MFGYIIIDSSSLNEEQICRYRAHYCGLCRTIGQQFGNINRITLNYDLSFLSILLSSLYEPDQENGVSICPIHPFQKNNWISTSAAEYAAAMNIALSHYKAIDNWRDEKSLSAKMMEFLLHDASSRVHHIYPRQCDAMIAGIHKLSRLESEHCQEPDLCAKAFGSIMEELLVWKQDRWEPILRTMGQSLGQFIYLLDAVMDLPEDIAKGRFNPLSQRFIAGNTKEHYYPVLKILLGECTDAMEKLPLIRDLDLIRNILYSGVWVRFNQSKEKEARYV